MKRSNVSRIIIIGSVLLVLCAVLFGVFAFYKYYSVDWSGAYKDTFITPDEEDENMYVKFSPLLEITDIGDSYSIHISFTISRVPAWGYELGGQVGGYSFVPVEIPKKSMGRHYIIKTKYDESDEQIGLYCEVEYIDEKSIRFRYAKTEEDLEEQEYYTLVKLKYSLY